MNEKELIKKLSIIITLNHLRDIIYKRNGKSEENVLSSYGIKLDFNLEEELQKILKKEDTTSNEYLNAFTKVLNDRTFKEIESLYIDFCLNLNLTHEEIESSVDEDINTFEAEKIKSILTKKGVEHFNKIIEDYKEYNFILLENVKLILEDKNQIADILRTNINTLDNLIKDKTNTKRMLTKNQAELIKEFCEKNISIPTKEEQNDFTFKRLLLEYDEALEFISFITLYSKENKYLKAIEKYLDETFYNTYNGKLLLIDAFKMQVNESEKIVKSLREKFTLLLEELKDKQSAFYKFNEEIKILQSETSKNYKLTKQDKPLESIEEVEVYYKNGQWIATSPNVIIEEKGANLYTRIENIRSHTPLTFNNTFERQVKLHEIKHYKNDLKVKAIKYLIQERINDLNANYDSERNILILSEDELEQATDLIETRNAQETLNNLMNLLENTKSDYLEINENKATLTSFSYFKIIKVEMYNNKIINYHLSLHPYFKDYFFKNKMQFLTGLKPLTAEQRVIEHRIGQIKNTDIENNKELTIIEENEVFNGIISFNSASRTHESTDRKKKHNAIADYSNISAIYDMTYINNEQWEVRPKRIEKAVELPEEQREIKPFTKTEVKKIIKELYPDIDSKNSEAIYLMLYRDNKLTLSLIHLKNEVKELYKILVMSANHKEVKPRTKKQVRKREDFINIAKENNININYALNCYAYMEAKQNLKLTDNEILTNISKFIESKYIQTQTYCLQNNFDFEKAKTIITEAFKKKINELSEDEFINALNIVKNKMQSLERIKQEEEQRQAEFNKLTPEEKAKLLKPLNNFWDN